MKGSPAKAAGTRGVTPGLPTGYTVYRHPGAPDEGKPGENSRDQSRNPWFTNNLHGIPAPGKGRKRRCSSHRCSGFRLMLCLPGRLRRPSTSPSRRRLPPCTIAVSASAGSRSTWASTTTRPRRLWAGSVRVDCGWVRFRALAALVLVPAVARFRPLLPVGPVALGRLRTARRCSYRRISSCLRRLPFLPSGAPVAPLWLFALAPSRGVVSDSLPRRACSSPLARLHSVRSRLSRACSKRCFHSVTHALGLPAS